MIVCDSRGSRATQKGDTVGGHAFNLLHYTEYMNFKASGPSTVYTSRPSFHLFSVFAAQTSPFTKRHFFSAPNQSMNGPLLLSLAPLILLHRIQFDPLRLSLPIECSLALPFLSLTHAHTHTHTHTNKAVVVCVLLTTSPQRHYKE